MAPIEIGIIGIVVLFIMLFLGMPVGPCMGFVGAAGFALITSFDGAMMKLGQTAFNSTASYILAVIPLFIIMGEFALVSKLTEDGYATLYKLVGHLPGGLAIATICACAGFAAVCGSSSATASTIASISLPEMRKYKYDDGFSLGTIAAGGTLGILIPPSTAFVLYALITEQSVGKLFLAGIIPGILLSLSFIIAIIVKAKLSQSTIQKGTNIDWRAKVASLKDLLGIFFLFFLVMGGIYTGIFTPTEAAAAGAFAAFIIAILRKQVSRSSLFAAFLNTFKTTGMIFILVIGATLFGYFIEISNISRTIGQFIIELKLSPILVLICILAMYMAMGCLLDSFSMLLIMTPIMFPLVVELGFDPIWFGVLSVIMVELGLITPPIGLNIFIMAGVAKDVPMLDIYRGVAIYVLAMILCIIVLIAFPQITLFLPDAM